MLERQVLHRQKQQAREVGHNDVNVLSQFQLQCVHVCTLNIHTNWSFKIVQMLLSFTDLSIIAVAMGCD